MVNSEQRVLLREPKGHYDGYVWTFPKGRPDVDESPEEAALREVREETGYAARVTGRLPGRFEGGTTVTEYFLMSAMGKPGAFDRKETTAVKWASLDEASRLISMTTNLGGRVRDLAVLDAVRAAVAPASATAPDDR